MSHRVIGEVRRTFGRRRIGRRDLRLRYRFPLALINKVATKSCKDHVMTITLLAVISLLHASTVLAQNDSLRVYAQQRGFYIGAAVSMTPFRNEGPYLDTLKREYNIIVAENAFKFTATHPAQNTYNFADTDALVTFAEANGMKIRGHTLLWHQQIPTWVTNGNFTRDETIAIMREHIHTLVGRYKGRIWAWDVVNEAIADGSSALRTNSFWYQMIGPDYIKLAFQFAHEADPDAILYLNDHSSETMNAKSTGVYNLVRDLKLDGVPINGVGWQMHITNGDRIGADHHSNAQRLAALGVEISITELDVKMQLPADSNKLVTQATTYRDVLEFCLSQPKCVSLITWGFTDKYSWIPGFFPGMGAALIFDENYQPKPAYDALRQVFIAAPPQPLVLTADQVTLMSWTYQGRTYAYVKLSFPDSAYRVANWGQAVRIGNDFSADASVQRFPGPSVQVVTTTAGIYDLGPLADGNYAFAFKNSSVVVKSQTFTVSSATPPPNPIDNAREFVRQQYRDFLNREADQAGEDFWTDNITKCNDPARLPAGQTVEQCTLRQRETTSGAFFLSPEFQYTSYYVLRMYKGALGRQPKLSEFTPDAQFVGAGILVNSQLSASKINQNKADFAAQFVNCTDATKSRCAEFKAIYDPLNNQQYVDKLFQTTGVTPTASDRAALVNGLNAIPATETRASVLQKVVDGINVISEGNQRFDTTYGQAFYNAELNRAFVQLEYFGYMKRDPDDAGYAFWLGKLDQFGGNFVNAEMVLAFISSPEYRARFGQP